MAAIVGNIPCGQLVAIVPWGKVCQRQGCGYRRFLRNRYYRRYNCHINIDIDGKRKNRHRIGNHKKYIADLPYRYI
jgi:hypothetical protein